MVYLASIFLISNRLWYPISSCTQGSILVAAYWKVIPLASEAVAPHQERQSQDLLMLLAPTTHPVLSSSSGSTTQREASHCPHPQLQRPGSEILLGGKAGHKTDSSSSLPKGTSLTATEFNSRSHGEGTGTIVDRLKIQSRLEELVASL